MEITEYFNRCFQLKDCLLMHKDLFSGITELTHFIRIQEKSPIGRRFPVPRLEQCSNNLERI
jgi:hypothetical protein